jgi:hypothetical protein
MLIFVNLQFRMLITTDSTALKLIFIVIIAPITIIEALIILRMLFIGPIIVVKLIIARKVLLNLLNIAITTTITVTTQELIFLIQVFIVVLIPI